MGFKKPNALFVFLCALAEVLSTQPECGDWFVFLSVFVYVDTPSSLKLQEDVSARPSPSFTHFPSQAFFFFFFLSSVLSACFFLLLSSDSLLPLGLTAFLPEGAEVSVIRLRTTLLLFHCSLLHVVHCTPSLGKWEHPPAW